MYENSNKDVLRELTQDNYRSHKTRNRLGIMAIALTTILITAVLTVGISVTTTALNYGESAPGPGSIGSIAGTMETKEQIQKEAAECGFHDCILKDTFEEALDTCVELARPGDAVLLSPACASWGMFPNYEVRGEEFKKYVNAL